MSFSIQNNYFQAQDNSYIDNYITIDKVYSPVLKNDNFAVGDLNNCFICSSISGKLYIVLPPASISKGRFLIFVNQTENELVSVDSLITLNNVSNVFSSNLSSTILNSPPQSFCILVSDGLIWYKMN